MTKSSEKIIYSSFNELSSEQMHDLLRLRQQVFVLEQTCLYEDIDGYDPEAMHLLIYIDRSLAAYSRIFPMGVKYDDASSIGRIVVHPDHRATGLGHTLIKESIRRCNGSRIRIEAQAALISYYNKLGFEEKGDVYVVDDIDHIEMIYTS